MTERQITEHRLGCEVREGRISLEEAERRIRAEVPAERAESAIRRLRCTAGAAIAVDLTAIPVTEYHAHNPGEHCGDGCHKQPAGGQSHVVYESPEARARGEFLRSLRPGTRVTIAHHLAAGQTFRLESDVGESVTVTSEQTSQTYQVNLGYLRPTESA